MSIQAMKQVIELYDKHCYNNDCGGIEFNRKHGYKFIEAIEALRTAIQRAESKPVAWPLRAQVWKRESTQEWVLEIAGTLGDTDMNIRHTQPLSVAYENVPGLPTFYTHPAPGVPDGWKLVPIEPTQEMLTAARRATEIEGITTTPWLRGCIYRTMLAASPAQKG